MINRRVMMPAAVAGLGLIAAFDPGLMRSRPLIDTLVVVDITRSMNVRDMDGVARLDYTRKALRDWIAARPCGSRVGLAVFTERRSLTLFEPVEICEDFAIIDSSLQALDWRMAWEGDSLISRGLNHSLARAAGLGVSLVFVTDGHEVPPLPFAGSEIFDGDSLGGIVLGVGGNAPAPIPMFDDLGREIGFYEVQDVQQTPSRVGTPPPEASNVEGYHARNNPYGETDEEGSEHLSEMKSSYLKELADQRGLGFLPISAGSSAIERELAAHAPVNRGFAFQSLAPVLGALATILLVSLWLAGLSRRKR